MMRGFSPDRPLLAALAVWLALGIAVAFQPGLLHAWWVMAGAIVLWAFSDFWLLHWQAPPAVQRHIASSLPLGRWSRVELRLHWSGPVPRRAEVFDHHPDGFAQEGMPAQIASDRDNTFLLRYRVRALSRGDHHFAGLALRLHSPLLAWRRQMLLEAPQAVRVYPDFSPLARHALHATDYRNAQIGQHRRRRRRRGQGMDFAQLREYREGDALRQIDWKASTRMGRMISREYQDERDQRILLMVDCGRRMGARDGELSHFDHALDAVLMLSYVGLSHGDSVGLMTLGGVDRYLGAQRSGSAVSRILHTIYDLQPSVQASDFERAAQSLMQRERKRALVVIFTNLRDEDDRSLLEATRLLRKRHLVLVASLRETALDSALQGKADNVHSAASLAAAVAYQASREAALRRLRAEGVLCLDVLPHKLAVETVNRYLAVKAAQQL